MDGELCDRGKVSIEATQVCKAVGIVFDSFCFRNALKQGKG
jgi:hypothetical protein